MKKGFSNFMTSIDSALKTNTSDDMSDTVSMQSDISSDSENFIHVLAADDKTADCMDVMFRFVLRQKSTFLSELSCTLMHRFARALLPD